MTYFIGFGNVFCKVLNCYMDISYDPILQVLIEHVPISAMVENIESEENTISTFR